MGGQPCRYISDICWIGPQSRCGPYEDVNIPYLTGIRTPIFRSSSLYSAGKNNNHKTAHRFFIGRHRTTQVITIKTITTEFCEINSNKKSLIIAHIAENMKISWEKILQVLVREMLWGNAYYWGNYGTRATLIYFNSGTNFSKWAVAWGGPSMAETFSSLVCILIIRGWSVNKVPKELQSRGTLLRGVRRHWRVAWFPLSQSPPRRAVCDAQSWLGSR
jgi:hypothetical protein